MKSIRLFIKENPHSLLLTYWIFFLIYFAILEFLVDPLYIIYSPIDDLIPFQAAFIIPYMSWFPLLVIPFAYFLFKDKESFQNLCFFMFSGMTISLLIYTVFPNGLALRVDNIGTGICAQLVQALQGIDSPTNVCPSIHVASTLAIWATIIRYQAFKHPIIIKSVISMIALMIMLSTMFLKQHSIIDVIAALFISLILYGITFHTNWRGVLSHTFLKRSIT